VEQVLFSWSGGKDSAMALYELAKQGRFQIAALLTTVTGDYDRISMHGVRRSLLERQAAALALQVEEVILPKESSNEDYEREMAEVLTRYRERGVKSVVFGDIFLEDLRQYREQNLARLGMEGIFPLWKRDTSDLIASLIGLGFKARTVCVDNHALGKEFVGRIIDEEFVSDLPAGVDVCGENGEYHSFVSKGPIFDHAIPCEPGEIVLRDDRFYFCDLVASDAC
jgi:uncharacterized protein (TIGR00290 family)